MNAKIIRGFTLIELLVVIAIIAILAAILFPVFAQAKAAAKKAATLSNAKQLTLGVIMYTGDSDDTAPSGTAWAPPSGPGGYPIGYNGWAATWAWLITPYVKSSQLFYDPQAPTTSPQSFGTGLPPDPVLTATTYPNFGYNYTYMSPWGPNGLGAQVYGIEVGISMTSSSKPAQTIMLAERGSAPEETPAYAIEEYGNGWTDASPIENVVVEAPNCYQINPYCADNWGIGNFASGASGNENTYASGGQTGGVAVRSAGQSVVTFIDGHAKAYNISNLAAGTTWSPTSIDTSLTWQGTNYQDVYLWGISGVD